MATPTPSNTPAQVSPVTCPSSSHTCAPACSSGYMCMQTVISSLGQCPVSSCIKQDADPAAGNGTDPTTPSSSKSIVGPVVGAVVGLAVIGALVFFIIRRRRRQRLRMIHSSSVMLDQDDYLESFSKRWHGVSMEHLIAEKEPKGSFLKQKKNGLDHIGFSGRRPGRLDSTFCSLSCPVDQSNGRNCLKLRR